MELIERNIRIFKEECINRGVSFGLPHYRGVPARELIEESRFADVLEIDAETSFNRRYDGTPTEFVRGILKKAEYPAVIAPASFESMYEIIFIYNESPSSVFAIKQFTYLFPPFCNKM